MITNGANVTISIQPAQVDAELRCRNERVLCGSTERGARMGWLPCVLCIADVKKTKQPESVRATCKAPWCGTSNAAHRSTWSKGVDLDYLKPRWRK